jgi:hypothetical protein
MPPGALVVRPMPFEMLSPIDPHYLMSRPGRLVLSTLPRVVAVRVFLVFFFSFGNDLEHYKKNSNRLFCPSSYSPDNSAFYQFSVLWHM